MMVGEVTSEREAVIAVRVRGGEGAEQTCEAIIDTGFNGFLVLRRSVIASLDLPLIGSVRAILATGEGVDLSLYEVVVIWDGHPRAVDVLASEGGTLAGMGMLEGFSLHIDVLAGGRVSIVPLSA